VASAECRVSSAIIYCSFPDNFKSLKVASMLYGLVHFPDIDFTKINQLRQRYDPTYRIIDPHITVMFPVPDSVGEENLIRHLTSVVMVEEAFSIQMSGLVKSWDHWLFLTLKEGNSRVIQLYDRIYSDILKPYKRSDIPFIPHIGLGLFAKRGAGYSLLDPRQVEFDEKRFKKALREAERMELNYHSKMDKLTLLTLTDDLSKIVWRKDFYLSHTMN
jgi:hypothetical protein